MFQNRCNINQNNVIIFLAFHSSKELQYGNVDFIRPKTVLAQQRSNDRDDEKGIEHCKHLAKRINCYSA